MDLWFGFCRIGQTQRGDFKTLLPMKEALVALSLTVGLSSKCQNARQSIIMNMGLTVTLFYVIFISYRLFD